MLACLALPRSPRGGGGGGSPGSLIRLPLPAVVAATPPIGQSHGPGGLSAASAARRGKSFPFPIGKEGVGTRRGWWAGTALPTQATAPPCRSGTAPGGRRSDLLTAGLVIQGDPFGARPDLPSRRPAVLGCPERQGRRVTPPPPYVLRLPCRVPPGAVATGFHRCARVKSPSSLRSTVAV